MVRKDQSKNTDSLLKVICEILAGHLHDPATMMRPTMLSSFLRHYCMNIPEILPKILLAVKWNSRDEVAQVATALVLPASL